MYCICLHTYPEVEVFQGLLYQTYIGLKAPEAFLPTAEQVFLIKSLIVFEGRENRF